MDGFSRAVFLVSGNILATRKGTLSTNVSSAFRAPLVRGPSKFFCAYTSCRRCHTGTRLSDCQDSENTEDVILIKMHFKYIQFKL